MSSNEGDFILDVHPLDGTNFIGTIKIEEVEEPNFLETIIILDQSGSMGRQVSRFTNMIIPLVLSILNYESQYVHLITFEDCSLCFYNTAEQFKNIRIHSSRGTYLSQALKNLKILLKTFEADQPIRILTISDGAILDVKWCDEVMKEILEILKESHFAINAQAVRLFTSNSQPDTKALCNLAMMNNTTTSSVVDISCDESDEVTATTIANLFLSDKFKCTKILKLESKIVYRFPWDLEPASEIVLLPGLNLFWLKGVPTVAKISNAYVKVNKQYQLKLPKFQELMEVKMDYFIDHMNILKIVGTAEADNRVDKILEYFENQEAALTWTCSNGQKKISMLLGCIARDENFKNLDSAQMADYLRVVTRKHIEEKQKKEKEEEQERIRQEEIQKKAQEEEQERIRQEELRMKVLEEEQERIRQDELRMKALEEEQERIRQDELRMKAQEEEQERIRQEELRKKAQEEDQERIRQEELRMKALEEEQERIRQDELRMKAQEEEQERIRQEELRKKAQEKDQERIRQEELRMKALEEEQERIWQDELRMKAQEEEQKRIRQEELRKKAQEEDQERIQQEELRMKAQEEEQERIRQEELRMKAHEEEQVRIRQEQLLNKAQEEEQERIRQEEIRKKAQENEQERIRKEEIRKNVEEQLRKQFEEEQRKKQETEDKLKQEQEDERYRKNLEEEHKKNHIFGNFLDRFVGYFSNYKFNFFIIIFIILFAIIELKLQLTSGTGCDL